MVARRLSLIRISSMVTVETSDRPAAVVLAVVSKALRCPVVSPKPLCRRCGPT